MAADKFSVFLLILKSLWTLIRADVEVSCILSESCILPCNFHPGAETIIHWVQVAENIQVHSFYYNKDQLGHQNQNFRNRTSLFKDQISRGNASLQLTGVGVQDQDRYKCYTSTTGRNKESFINLRVDAPVSKVNMEQVGNRIICSSEGIYPKPDLTWSTRPPSNLNLQNQTSIQQTEQQLYNISSSLILSDSETDLIYICTISTRKNWRRVSLFKPTSKTTSDSETTIPCTESRTKTLTGLVWRFNHSQIIVTKSGANVKYTVSEEWRQQVKGVSESGSLMLQDLSSHHEGKYSCEVSDAEETLITNTFLRREKSQDTEVSCVFMESCILPCSFQSGAETIIHWILVTAGDPHAHSYYSNQDQLGLQHQRFRGRTSLFKDQISRGNASLQLTGVEVQDQDRYRCFTSTMGENKESLINLRVDAPVSKVNMEQVGNRIICSSEGIYPEPDLTWSTRPPSNLNLQNQTSIQQTEQQLYNISSSLILSDSETDLSYICTISTRKNWRRVTLFKTTFINGSNPETTISCPDSITSITGFSLTWRFNHSQIILNQSRADISYTVSEEWRQQVKGVSESGSLMLQDLSSHHEGIYSCEVSDAEETLITNTFLRREKSQDTEVSCVFMESCILPCSFQSGADPVIHWIQETAGNPYVHSYYSNQDQLGLQDQYFRGRTSLFKDQISRGNASLQLTGVEVQDEDIYKCHTSTNRGSEDSLINLRVDAPVSKVNMEQVGNRIICSSEGIYPEPDLTWSTRPPSNLNLQNQTSIQQTEQQLYNISSSLILSDSETDLSYICTISTHSNSRRVTLFKTIFTFINGSNPETTISCPDSITSITGFSLTWRFNHSQIILNQSRADISYTVSEEWRQQVKGVSESGSLMLQDLSSHHEGIYSCEVSDAEETLITNTFLRREKSQDTEVSCVFMESCILPCSFQSGADPIIHWIQVTAGNLYVHSFYNNQDQLRLQNQHFRNRTSLFKDQISRGNASLQLTGVEVQDQGGYRCYTSTMRGKEESFINLRVDAPVSKVNMEQVGNRIICSSEGIYPEPDLTWSTSPPSNLNLQNQTSIQQTEQQLYNISSSLILSDSETDLIYICTISTHSNSRRAALCKTNTEVSCVFMESCILPCSFQNDTDPVIHWIKETGHIPVHSFYSNQDQLTDQDHQYINRTSLFKDQISRGNASLQLTGVEVQDQGGYICCISTMRGEEASCINLRVDAPVSKVNMEQVGNRIICSSEGIYPEPDLTWSTRPPSNLTLQNQTSIQQTEQQLYNISSSLILSDSETDLIYICTISTRSNSRNTTWRKPHTEVSCVFMESCILPCSFQSGADPVIHWILVTAGNLHVHSFYFNQDQLGLQDQRFRNRTSLFKDQISRGNASLQLTGVEVQDQGGYRCFTSTMRGKEESFINLRVDAPVSKVNMEQ
ncbi:immunoglobulin superfamily member 10 isoform X4 [Lates calcarifer]|uniref:immunoglobulin superfamily member 10 isoform X4 n=1 Tax=Lates calcarifer TaxID=8187 RepID=UPI0021D7AABB|nr:immunoglobulin superfamily member 10 isoform X4 [Lates calcarifer]